MGQCGAWVLEELGRHFPPNILLCNGDGDGDDDGEEQKRGGGQIIQLNVFIVARNKCHQIRSNIQCDLCAFYVIRILIKEVFIL